MEVKKMTEPNIEPEPTFIHPAIDFTAEHAYIGQWLLSRTNRVFAVIKDDQTITQFPGNQLTADGIVLTHCSACIESRWSSESITRFHRNEENDISGPQLFKDIKEKLMLYIELPDEKLYDFLTLWIAGTYFIQIFNTYPYVYVSGIFDSGKSKLLILCSCLSFNSIISANMSTATIFRLVQDERCSLFIDETDQLSQRRAEDFRNILLSGYRKGLGAYRNRKLPDGNFVPERFEVYGPKMLANIQGLDEVLQSRCVTIIMRRASNRDISNREIEIDDPTWQRLRDKIYPFVMRNWRTIKEGYVQINNDTTLQNRDWELWKPIFVLALPLGGTELLARMKDLATKKAEERNIDNQETHEYILVEVLLSIVEKDGYYDLGRIKEEMAERFADNYWLTERYIGRLLRNLGFSNRRRLRTGTQYFLKYSEIRELAQRLGIGVVSEGSEDNTGQSINTVMTDMTDSDLSQRLTEPVMETPESMVEHTEAT
jgi:hypothetical protein